MFMEFKSNKERDAFYTGFVDAKQGNPPVQVNNIKEEDLRNKYEEGYELGIPENGLSTFNYKRRED